MGVRYLLDTHAFLWLTATPERLPQSLRTRLASYDSLLLVSSASAMEIATKVRLGKLPQAESLATQAGWEEALEAMRADELPMTTRHSLLAGRLPWTHRDPFDRILAAQALCEGIDLVSADQAFSTLPELSVQWGEESE